MIARERCSCGCGQPTAATMRMRKLACELCGCPLRMSRSWLETNGAPQCGCGGAFVPECLEDRCRLPGSEGQAAWAEYMGRATVSAQQAEYGQRGGKVQALRKRARAQAVKRGDFTPDHTGHLIAVATNPVTAF